MDDIFCQHLYLYIYLHILFNILWAFCRKDQEVRIAVLTVQRFTDEKTKVENLVIVGGRINMF